MKNKVVAGDFEGEHISLGFGILSVRDVDSKKSIILDKRNLEKVTL